MQNKEILSFHGDHHFLSNFHSCQTIYKGVTFQNSEAAFQAQKEPARAHEFANLEPGASKKLGFKVKLIPNWDKLKDQVMYDVVKAKFSQNPDLLTQLLATGDVHLEEGNTWRDRYWGTVNRCGQNKLGCILMRLRAEQKNLI